MDLFPGLLFWIYSIVFVIAISLAFFIPADILLKRYGLTFFQRLILSTCLGIVMWGWQGYIFGYLNIRWASYVYLAIFLIFWVKLNLATFKANLSFAPSKSNIVIISIIVVGSIIQLSLVWLAGISRGEGVFFHAYSLPDNFWYIDLTNEVIRRIPPFEPGMFGKVIENYHYWSNLVMAELIRVFRLPLIPTISQYFTVLITILLGGTFVVFAQIVRIKKSILIWILLFIYFGGDFVNVIQLIFGKGIDFTQQSMEDGAKFLVNAPRAFALVLFFAGISFICLYLKKRKNLLGFLSAFILGSLIGFKVYVGFFALTGMIFLCFYCLFKKKYNFIIFTVFAIILSVLIYMPINNKAGGLVYTGFWRAEDFIVLPSFGLSHMELARKIYASHNNWLRVLQYDLLFLLISTIGTFGTKIIGILQSKNTLRIFPVELNIFLIPSLIVSFIAGTFFIQSAGGSNSFNFLVSVYIIGSIYAGTACAYWFEKLKNYFKIIAIVTIILLTIPRTAYLFAENAIRIYRGNGSVVSSSDLEFFEYVKTITNPSSLLIVQQGVPFISFIVNRPVFLYNKGILITHEVDISPREKAQNNILNSDKISLVANELMKHNIDFIYKSSSPLFLNSRYNEILDTVYDKNGIQILKVNKIKLKKFI